MIETCNGLKYKFVMNLMERKKKRILKKADYIFFKKVKKNHPRDCDVVDIIVMLIFRD